MKFLQTACDSGHNDSCNELILAKFEKADNKDNLDFLDEKCNQEIASACYILAGFY